MPSYLRLDPAGSHVADLVVVERSAIADNGDMPAIGLGERHAC
jgi:hypothetical protein